MKILSAEQIRQWDAYTMEHEPVNSINLMERAATKCVDWILQNNAGQHFMIFCGKGNNGGDGLAIARLLSKEKIRCKVCIIEAGTTGSPDFITNFERLHLTPVEVVLVNDTDTLPAIGGDTIIIDALYGTGLNRPLQALPAAVVAHINNAHVKVVAIDIPSGLFCDMPTAPTLPVIKANFTLTFQVIKLSFLYPENEVFFGDVSVLDIGLHPGYLKMVSSNYTLTDKDLIKKLYKPRKNFSHKGTYGHALVIAGEKGKMGAALLCSRACLRAGTGLVSGMVPKDQFQIIQTAVPEVMAMTHQELETLEWAKYTTIGIGPGIGTHTDGTRLVKKVLTHFNKPMVVDADGLNIVSMQKELLDYIPANSILSPHPKEFERLFGKSGNQAERIETAVKESQRLSLYIIIKGHNSVLACPDGQVYFNNTGNAGMATGGSGDVLTGILTGLLAQGYSSKAASLLGMYLHGLAADIAVKALSQEALIAGDIIEYLGKAFLEINA